MKVQELIEQRVNAARDRLREQVEHYDNGRITMASLIVNLKVEVQRLASEMFDFGFNIGVNVEATEQEDGGQVIGELELEEMEDDEDDEDDDDGAA